jgi:Na+(H+)/acetate symporter ActP
MKNIRWGWILLGGFLAELVVFAIVIPIAMVAGRQSLLYSAAPASFVGALLLGLWVARKSSQPVLHGALVGVVAMLIYVAMTRAQPEPTAYLVAHVLKVLGGAAGGWLASMRTAPGVVTAAPPK